METLSEPLAFHDAHFIALNSYPSEKNIKCVAIIEASCMPHHAELLGCSYIYKEGIPVADLSKASIEAKFADVDVFLPNAKKDDVERYSPELIYKFALTRVADAKFNVQFRIHETTRRADLEMLLTAFNKEEFSLKIVSKQTTLFDGGTRVDMTPDEAEAEPEDAPDRSHENKPKGGRRGKKNVQPISEVVASAIVNEAKGGKVDEQEWDAFYDAKHEATTVGQEDEALIQ